MTSIVFCPVRVQARRVLNAGLALRRFQPPRSLLLDQVLGLVASVDWLFASEPNGPVGCKSCNSRLAARGCLNSSSRSALYFCCLVRWHFLNFFPLPHGHGSLRPAIGLPIHSGAGVPLLEEPFRSRLGSWFRFISFCVLYTTTHPFE